MGNCALRSSGRNPSGPSVSSALPRKQRRQRISCYLPAFAEQAQKLGRIAGSSPEPCAARNGSPELQQSPGQREPSAGFPTSASPAEFVSPVSAGPSAGDAITGAHIPVVPPERLLLEIKPVTLLASAWEFSAEKYCSRRPSARGIHPSSARSNSPTETGWFNQNDSHRFLGFTASFKENQLLIPLKGRRQRPSGKLRVDHSSDGRRRSVHRLATRCTGCVGTIPLYPFAHYRGWCPSDTQAHSAADSPHYS